MVLKVVGRESTLLWEASVWPVGWDTKATDWGSGQPRAMNWRIHKHKTFKISTLFCYVPGIVVRVFCKCAKSALPRQPSRRGIIISTAYLTFGMQDSMEQITLLHFFPTG